MTTPTQCGDRRCTLEDAETMFGAYQNDYTLHIQHLSKEDIDALPPSMTRIKTEIDEMHELLERAKQNGAAGWDAAKDAVQSGLDRIAEALHQPKEVQPK